MSRGRLRPASLALLLLAACAGAGERDAGAGAGPLPPSPPVRVLAAHPHDVQAFTQGLLFADGRLYESTGLYGRSELREVEPASGRVLRRVTLPADQFGEGLALAGERLVQLTWREQGAWLWSRRNFAPLGRLAYRGEGWGLTWDGQAFVQSDGSAALQFRAAADFRALRTLAVTRQGRPVPYLNELEWAEGAIYANVWQSDEILRIDPASGEVTGSWDAAGLLEPGERERADVLNGIAWDPGRRVFYVTGKLWPRLFEVELAAPGAVRR